MKNAIEWLLDLEHVNLQDAGRLSLQFLRPLDGWLWFIIFVVILLFVAALYRREPGGLVIRGLMAACRVAVLLMAVTLFCQPALVYRQDRVEPSTLAVMIDDSASMAREDHYDKPAWSTITELVAPPQGPDSPAERCTRWELVRGVLEHDDRAVLRALARTHELRVFRFAGAVSGDVLIRNEQEVGQIQSMLDERPPGGLSTNLAEALRHVLEACADAHLAGIVLLTDGQPTQQADWERLAQSSAARGTALYPVVIGSTQQPKDLALQRVHMPRNAYLGDQITCGFTVQATALPAGTPFEVEVRDQTTQTVMATGTFQTGSGEEPSEHELQINPQQEGRHELVVEVRPARDELNTRNNSRQSVLHVVEDKARVLYVEGYPRYEYRFLKNMLLREPSVVLSALLLSADERFIQEGSEPIRHFPDEAEELMNYDVVLIGDLNPQAGWIAPHQLEFLADFVTHGGGGIGFIAGERFCPQRFYGTPLEALVPVELSGHVNEDLAPAMHVGFKPQLTAAGRESPILRLLLEQSDRQSLFERLPDWYWAAPVRGARPGAEVLLEHPLLAHGDQHLPLVVVKRHGAGTVFYQGSDDTWRWRRYHGEAFFDIYWLQVIRFLAQQKQFPASQGIILRPQRTVVDPMDPVVLTLSIEDPELAAQVPDEVVVQVRQADAGVIDQLMLRRLSTGSQHFQGSFEPRGVGQFELVFQTGAYALDRPDATTLVEVQPQWLEQRRPEANLELMEQLAERTGGVALSPGTAHLLPEVIPAKKYTIPNDLTETIWDSRLALGAFVLLIAMEWILRKRRGLA